MLANGIVAERRVKMHVFWAERRRPACAASGNRGGQHSEAGSGSASNALSTKHARAARYFAYCNQGASVWDLALTTAHAASQTSRDESHVDDHCASRNLNLVEQKLEPGTAQACECQASLFWQLSGSGSANGGHDRVEFGRLGSVGPGLEKVVIDTVSFATRAHDYPDGCGSEHTPVHRTSSLQIVDMEHFLHGEGGAVLPVGVSADHFTACRDENPDGFTFDNTRPAYHFP